MMVQPAVVTKRGNGVVWVKSYAQKACGGCLQQETCGTRVLSSVLPKREFAITCDLPLNVGDCVDLQLEEGYLLVSSLIMYVLPLFMTLTAVVLLSHLTVLNPFLPELALATLLTSFALIHYLVMPLIGRFAFLFRVKMNVSKVTSSFFKTD